MKQTFLFLIIISLNIFCVTQKGIVIKPIIDLIGHPLAQSHIAYTQLPVASTVPEKCPRIHQLVFHEIVNIIKETKNEYCIDIPQLFYITQNSTKKQNCYWTHKDGIVPLKELKNIDIKKIPQPINYKKQNTPEKNTITLQKPFYAKELGITFSVGTRFVIKSTARRSIRVYALNPTSGTIITISIPRDHCLLHNSDDKQTKIKRYVDILHLWAQSPGTIPYVWGGCSLNASHQTLKFSLCKNENAKEQNNYLIDHDSQSTKTGFDCAGLIARAAQTAGLPYYYKNTHTLATYLKPVTEIKELQNGDLIWIPGHVMAISNIKKGTIIEARHYSHGYGKVQELPISDIFKEINTFEQLFNAIKNKTALKRLNSKGEVIQHITQAKILSMQSCFEL